MERVVSRLNNRLSVGNGPLPYNSPLLFVIPSEAEGSAVLRTFPGNVFSCLLRGECGTNGRVTGWQQ